MRLLTANENVVLSVVHFQALGKVVIIYGCSCAVACPFGKLYLIYHAFDKCLNARKCQTEGVYGTLQTFEHIYSHKATNTLFAS